MKLRIVVRIYGQHGVADFLRSEPTEVDALDLQRVGSLLKTVLRTDEGSLHVQIAPGRCVYVPGRFLRERCTVEVITEEDGEP